MRINNLGYDYTNKKSNINFGLNIYGSIPTTKLKTFFIERGMSERNYYKFLDKIKNLAGDDISLRFARFSEGNNINKPSCIEYVLSAKNSDINNNGGYIKIRNKSVIKMKNLIKKLSDDITSIKAKLAENSGEIQPKDTNSKTKPVGIIKKFIAKLFKIEL